MEAHRDVKAGSGGGPVGTGTRGVGDAAMGVGGRAVGWLDQPERTVVPFDRCGGDAARSQQRLEALLQILHLCRSHVGIEVLQRCSRCKAMLQQCYRQRVVRGAPMVKKITRIPRERGKSLASREGSKQAFASDTRLRVGVV
jgi:hypothetical protein